MKYILLLLAIAIMPFAKKIGMPIHEQQTNEKKQETKLQVADNQAPTLADLDYKRLQTQAAMLTDARATQQIISSRTNRVITSVGSNIERTPCRLQHINKLHSLLNDCFGERLHPRQAALFAPAPCLYYVYWLRHIIR